MDTRFQTLDEQIEVVQNHLFELQYGKEDLSQVLFLLSMLVLLYFGLLCFYLFLKSICEDIYGENMIYVLS